MEKTKIKSRISWAIAIIFALAGLLTAIIPFIFMILNSFKDKFEMLTNGIFALPKQWSFANYKTVLEANFPRYFLNSVIVLVISLTLLLFIAACASYPLSRIKFKANGFIFSVIVACMAIPVHITLIPIFRMSQAMHVYDTIWALIGPYVAISGTSILVLFIFLLAEMIYVTEKTSETIESQTGIMASNYEETLGQYWNFSVALVINDALQDYCSVPMGDLLDLAAKDINAELTNMLNIQNNLNFVAVIREEDGRYYYKGNTSLTDARFEGAYPKDYQNSIPMRGETGMRLSYDDSYYRPGEYTLTLYYPVYSTTNLLKQMGLLVMNMEDSFIDSIITEGHREMGNEMFLID